MDNTRQGYICYSPATLTTFSRAFDRINDERLIFTMAEDQVASWYPRLFDVDNVIWHLVTRPMTKEIFEGFNEEYIGGVKIKTPVQSCVFCPGGRGMSNSTNDDEPIVQPQTLVGTHEEVFKDGNEWKATPDWVKRRDNWKDRAMRYSKLNSAEELSGVLNAIAHDPNLTKNLSRKQLDNLRDMAGKIRGQTYIQGLSDGAKENLNRTQEAINNELHKRDVEDQELENNREFLEQKKQQLQNQQADHENDRGRFGDELRANKAEIDRKQNKIRKIVCWRSLRPSVNYKKHFPLSKVVSII